MRYDSLEITAGTNAKSLQLIWRSETIWFDQLVPDFHISCRDLTVTAGYRDNSPNSGTQWHGTCILILQGLILSVDGSLFIRIKPYICKPCSPHFGHSVRTNWWHGSAILSMLHRKPMCIPELHVRQITDNMQHFLLVCQGSRSHRDHSGYGLSQWETTWHRTIPESSVANL